MRRGPVAELDARAGECCPARLLRPSGTELGECEELPLAGDAFEGSRAQALELQFGAGDKVFHGRGDEYLSGFGKRRYTGADVHGESGDLVVDNFAFAGVQSRADFDAELAYCGADCVRAADGSDWPVEAGEEAVAGGVDLFAAETGELLPDEGGGSLDQLAPARIAQLR